ILAAMPEPHTIEASEVRGALGGRDYIVSGHRQRQIRQTHFTQRRAELLVYAQRITDATLDLGVEPLVEELLQQADLQSLQRRLQGAEVVGDVPLDTGGIVWIESSHGTQQQRRILRRGGDDPALVETRCKRNHAVPGNTPVSRLDPCDPAQSGRLTNRPARVSSGCRGSESRGDDSCRATR